MVLILFVEGSTRCLARQRMIFTVRSKKSSWHQTSGSVLRCDVLLRLEANEQQTNKESSVQLQ